MWHIIKLKINIVYSKQSCFWYWKKILGSFLILIQIPEEPEGWQNTRKIKKVMEKFEEPVIACAQESHRQFAFLII